jgi:hyperosmotically inducible protein
MQAAFCHSREDQSMIPRALVALLLLAPLVVGCQTMTGRSAGRYVDDTTIDAKVKAKLTTEKASNFTRINVNTVNRVVHLEGVVDSVHDKVMAEELARQVDGVANVVNQLQITGSGAASPRSR